MSSCGRAMFLVISHSYYLFNRPSYYLAHLVSIILVLQQHLGLSGLMCPDYVMFHVGVPDPPVNTPFAV